MEDERESIESGLRERGESLLWLDLKSIGDENRLLRRTFESKAFIDWTKGNHVLHLYLDSLDECRLQVPNVAALLAEQLREFREHAGRLRFRIACRTAEWPSQLEDALPEVWGKEQVGAFELAPLRRRDVHLAAEIEGVNPDTFLAEIVGKDAQPLAIKPVTLRFLVNVYNRDGGFPAQHAELYREGCQLLVAEPSQSRNDSGQRGHLGSAQRLAVATRIAAVSMFCKRPAIYAGRDPGEASADDVRIEELCGGTEPVDGVTFSIGESEIREVLDTGLISSRGPYRLGFAHQTYAEFLAARYLIARGLEAKQILGLIHHSEGSGGAVVPQLAETAAWLAEMHPGVFQEVLRSDPKILLRSDVAQATPQDREILVGSLLQLFLVQELRDERDLRDGYRRLQHPGLAQQLAPYIRLGREAWLVRGVAIDIAESCKLMKLQDLLLEIALDPQDFQPTRVEAATAVARMGSKEARRKLLPLALGVAEDTDDELKGTALRELWPEVISTKKLFRVLTPVKNQHLYGSYRNFLDRHLLAGLQDSDLAEALRWVQEHPRDRHPLSPLTELTDKILVMAFESADSPTVRDALVDALLARAERIDRMTEPDSIDKAESALRGPVRYQIVEQVISSRADFHQKRWCLSLDLPRLARPEDLEWVLSKLRDSATDGNERDWAQLALSIFSPGQPKHANMVLEEAPSNPALTEAFKGLLGSIALDSQEASKLKASFELTQAAFAEMRPALLKPSPSERIEACLADFERGDLDAWWKLVREMTLNATSTYYGDELEPLLTKLPGWMNADQHIRKRLLNAARSYVCQWKSSPKKWFGKNIISPPDFAGYEALCLLAAEEPTLVDDLPPEAWEQWIPIVLGYPLSTPSEEDEDDVVIHHAVVARAYRLSPESFLSVLSSGSPWRISTSRRQS